MEIVPGVYETLISQAIEEKLAGFPDTEFLVKKEDIDSADSYMRLADYLADVVSDILKDYFRDRDAKSTISKQVDVVNRILKFIEDEWRTEQIDTEQDQLCEESKLQFLRGIYSKIGYTEEQVEAKARNHPVSGYRVSNLFTGGNDISLDDEVRRDIQTADQIDLVVSFIKFEGLRLLIDELRKFVQRSGTRLRVITTTYMGATDPKAIRRLYELAQIGDVMIRASFNTQQERLHAKAYIFNRHNGFNTAYIGSSNLSRSALTKGLEWNMRVTSVENPHIINKTKATFDNYWNSDDFEPIDSEEALKRFEDAIWKERHKERNNDGQPEYIVRFERKTHQVRVLEKLQYEREVVHSNRNLIIAATGTGKTAISAFDFKDFDKRMAKEKGRRARLLFVVHREKILKQARSTFRSVMVDANFGEIWTGRISPNRSGNLNHLFTTIQTLNNHWDDILLMGAGYYDYVVIDEVHHSQAGSYREIFSRLQPELFIGLTATPERMDGKDIKPDFNNRFAAEIRLEEALNQQLLAPFDYFCVTDDSVDLSRIASKREQKFFESFYYTIWMDTVDKINRTFNLSIEDIPEAVASLSSLEWFVEELSVLVELRQSQLSKTTQWISIDDEAEIELYGCYSADEIHLLLENKLGRWQVFGTQYNMERKFAMVFVTINKSDKEYSPRTRYEDYAISANQFHWQSMNGVRIDSEEGQRIIQQPTNGWKYILFVRDTKKDEYGNTNGYYCLGLIDYKSSTGERPMNVVWDMQHSIPGFILETAKAV